MLVPYWKVPAKKLPINIILIKHKRIGHKTLPKRSDNFSGFKAIYNAIPKNTNE